MKLVRPRDLLVTLEPEGMVMLRSSSRAAGALAPAWAVGVLSACDVPRTREEVVQLMGPSGGQAYDGLRDAGLLVEEEEAAETPVIFANYAGVDVHRVMLNDEVRLSAYHRAIQATVRPGDVVIDAGSGTGVLATMAALAGARKVYAIERTEFARIIPQVAADSGVGDKVEVIRGDFASVVLPEKARVLVTETYGHLAFAEGLMGDVLACARNNLLPDGVLLPRAFTLWMAPMPVAPPDLLGVFRKRDDGVDLRCLLGDARGRADDRLVPADQVGTPFALGRVDMPCDTPWEGELVLDEPCEAICAWFNLHLADGIDMPSGPADPPTHWKQTVLPIALDAGRHPVRITTAPEDRRTIVVDISGHEVRSR